MANNVTTRGNIRMRSTLRLEARFKSIVNYTSRSEGLVTIGELAKQAGLRPSAIRYYERLGLVPAPPRRNGRRDYGTDALANLAVVQFARECGFTVAQTKQLV